MSVALYHINPDRKKPWNDLPDLPIHEGLYREVEIYEALGRSKASLGRLQGRSAAIPNQGLLINTISLQEAKLSSEIENIFTTDDELYKAYSDNLAQEGPSKEVLRYRQALWSGLEHLESSERFDKDYFVKIYRELTRASDGIRPDFTNTRITSTGSGPNAGSTIYTPPKGQDLLNKKLENLLQFINEDENYPVDPILKMIIAHFQFEAIHPFRDGNGRTGRIFNIHFLTQKGLLDMPILFLSRYILDHKNDYYAGLSGVSQRADWKSWFVFMLRAVESTADLTYKKINDIIATKDNILDYIEKDKRKFRNPEKLVDLIFTQPFTKVSHLVATGAYAENTARDYLNRLSEIGVLEKRNLSGHHYYRNIELYRILSE
jgi:Fic family protein